MGLEGWVDLLTRHEGNNGKSRRAQTKRRVGSKVHKSCVEKT